MCSISFCETRKVKREKGPETLVNIEASEELDNRSSSKVAAGVPLCSFSLFCKNVIMILKFSSSLYGICLNLPYASLFCRQRYPAVSCKDSHERLRLVRDRQDDTHTT